jgi:hypothetical protein
MEDTYIGILAKLLNIKVVHNSGFLPHYISGLKLKDKLSSPDYKSYFAIIDVRKTKIKMSLKPKYRINKNVDIKFSAHGAFLE